MVGALVAAGLVATGGTPEPAVEPQIEHVADAPKLVVLQQNTDGNRARFDKAIAAAGDKGAHAVILQEVCQSWLDSVPGAWTSHYAETKTGGTANPCSGPHPDKGVLVAWTRPVVAGSVEKKTFRLEEEPLDKSRKPKLACLDVRSAGAYTVCGTHLVAFNKLPCPEDPTQTCEQGAPEIRRKQAKEIRDRLNAWIPARRVILGGDFNTVPKDEPMDYIYARPAAGSKNGKFTEATQLGAKAPDRRAGLDTAGNRKIDYLFFSKNFVPFRHPGSLGLKFISAPNPKGEIKAGHARLIARVKIDRAIPAATAAGSDQPAAPAPAPAPAPVPVPTCDNDCHRAQMGVHNYVYVENSTPSDVRLRRIVFDRKFYADTYPDVRPWAESKVQTQGGNLYDHVQWHWLNYGIPWGRMGSGTFDPAYYLSIYPDVAAAYGATNYTGAINHFVAHGQHEGRRGSIFFDANYYKGRYGDLAGHSTSAALQHFTVSGMSEGRQGSADFGPAYYLGTNPDLRNAFGRHYRRGMGHWISNGRAEGRPGAP